MVRSIINIFIIAVVSIASMMGSAEGGLIAYLRGDCDIICARCKMDCERTFKPGTFKRWWCKGNCKVMQSK